MQSSEFTDCNSHKICVIGDASVGKSAIISRFINNEFLINSKATIGVEFHSKELITNHGIFNLQIWDTAGQERYRGVSDSYFKDSLGVVLVFDLTCERSFQNLEEWVEKIRNNTSENCTGVIIGNKKDLIEERVITKDKAIEYCKSKNYNYYETSAKEENETNNIEKVFQELNEEIYKKNGDKTKVNISSYSKLSKKKVEKINEENEEKSGCC